MIPNDNPTTSSSGPTDPDAEAFDDLRDRIRDATAAAQRLAREAAASGADSGRPPPRGYAIPGDDGHDRGPDPLVALLGIAQAALPVELARELAALVKELLLALKALVEWALGRMDARRVAPVDVQDIPIV